ncbi:MAG: TauD/TfdA family dioxygenase [Deltaproteobacteria bacterium]|nr:TauD/TfdA family dioxygenase [Deltaproteobacteria bacterium]
MASYRSQIRQSLHYFARPQESILRAPLVTAAAWRGEQLVSDPIWREVLSSSDVAEIERAIRHARSLCKPDGTLRRRDFPLPTLARRIDGWRHTLRHGRGFQVITGVPVDRWSQRDAELFFWCFGLHLGVPGAQNPRGDLLGHVRDTGAPADGSVRQYRTNEHIDFHCDLADVVGLLCLRAAARGGASRIASSVTAYNVLLARRPDLVTRLYEPFLMDTKGEGGVRYLPVVPCAYASGELRTFWHIGYFRAVARYADAPPIDTREAQILDLYDAIMNEPGFALEMDLAPGDIQLVSNHTIVHGRTAFDDAPHETEKRHLLRLWLSLPERVPLGLRLRTERSRLQVLGRLAHARLGRD